MMSDRERWAHLLEVWMVGYLEFAGVYLGDPQDADRCVDGHVNFKDLAVDLLDFMVDDMGRGW
jgi:hypothetical protein